MGKNFLICFGIGWVCENHPHRAWHDKLGGLGSLADAVGRNEPDL
jgi:hypothetical protein